jgi:hypothetical protein
MNDSKSTGRVPVMLRLPGVMVGRIDRLCPPGVPRATMIVTLLTLGLDQVVAPKSQEEARNA